MCVHENTNRNIPTGQWESRKLLIYKDNGDLRREKYDHLTSGWHFQPYVTFRTICYKACKKSNITLD